MKRGKDEEKTMGPMFPRLHVNDTEKGGPRAPPRNKMALYEQLSIPTQRFTGGMLPANLNSNSNPNPTANSIPPSSSTQGAVRERSSFFPLQQPHSVHSSERTNNRFSNLNNQLVQQEQKKKQEEDDFRVPIFIQQSGLSPNCSSNHQNRDNEGPSPFGSGFASRLAKVQNACEQRNCQEFAKSSSNQPPRQNAKVPVKQNEGFSTFGHRNDATNSSIRLQGNGSVPDCGVDPQADKTIWGDSVSNEAIRAVGLANSLSPVRDSQEEVITSPNDPTNGDAVSETSIIDSISRADISPDDVVGIIGQKHFWKARRAIVNQQRVFAVQVFELHRLIKVQRLIAGSPHLLVEEDAFLGKPVAVSPTKKIPLEYVLKSTQNVPKPKDISEKPNEELEFSAENAVGKASISSVQNGSLTTHHKTLSGNLLPPSDPKMGSWGFSQPAGHQWLIPVMSPSEGLVYKPYPGPGFMNPVCGGYGPLGSSPFLGQNFVNYGVPPPQHHYHYQRPPGVHPFGPPASHGYFPPYGMQMMNPSISSSGAEQMNPFNNLQHQGSCNVPSDKNTEEVPSVAKFHGAKHSEAQGSTASSPIERTQGRHTNPLPLLPTSPPPPPQETEPTRVIRVVPHNARLATESVARIFQSIQEERKQFDSM